MILLLLIISGLVLFGIFTTRWAKKVDSDRRI